MINFKKYFFCEKRLIRYPRNKSLNRSVIESDSFKLDKKLDLNNSQNLDLLNNQNTDLTKNFFSENHSSYNNLIVIFF